MHAQRRLEAALQLRQDGGSVLLHVFICGLRSGGVALDLLLKCLDLDLCVTAAQFEMVERLPGP